MLYIYVLWRFEEQIAWRLPHGCVYLLNQYKVYLTHVPSQFHIDKQRREDMQQFSACMMHTQDTSINKSASQLKHQSVFSHIPTPTQEKVDTALAPSLTNNKRG